MQQRFYCSSRGAGSWDKSKALVGAFPCLLAVGRAKMSISRATGAGTQHDAALSKSSKS